MNNWNIEHAQTAGKVAATESNVKAFVSSVFIYMAGALLITAATAYVFSTMEGFLQLIYNVNPATGVARLNFFGYAIVFAPLVMVLIMGAGFNRLSAPALFALFFTYSALMGMSLSSVFLVYTGASIFKTFVVTAATFGTMAVVGYTTKTDLTKFGSILIMALIGIIIASIINMIWYSSTMDLIISIIGVLIFTGLTAYDAQKIKQLGYQLDNSTAIASKFAVMGALNLYLDFINLFLFLLRFLGDRRN
jgi:hypothetical protein